MDDLEDLIYLERDIKASAVVLLFLTKSYFKSINCLREVRACEEEDKPLILVREMATKKGGALMEDMKEECPEDLRDAVFGGRDVIPWLRLGHFQRESLCCIAECMLLCLPRYAKELDAANAKATAALGASKIGTPWVLLQGKHVETDGLLKQVCDAIGSVSSPPAGCATA